MSTYFINGEGKTDLTSRVMSLINGAKTYIKTGNFLFQDETIINALHEAMARGVVLFIISNLRDPEESSGKKHSPMTEEIVVDMQMPYLNGLRRSGAHCHFLDELHAKFIIVDGEKGLLMSANYARNSLDRNIETGILLNTDETRDLEYVFDKLYTNADIQNFEYSKDKKKVRRSTNLIPEDTFDCINSNLRLTISSPEIKGRKSRTNLAQCHVTTIYESIVEIINSSELFVFIVTWHFRSLELLPEFMKAVKDALERNVKVYLYSNAYGESQSLNDSLVAINQLKEMGCESHGDDNNHSKCVINEKEGIIFTANIDGVHGMTTGFEVGCMLDKEQHFDVLNHVVSLVNR